MTSRLFEPCCAGDRTTKPLPLPAPQWLAVCVAPLLVLVGLSAAARAMPPTIVLSPLLLAQAPQGDRADTAANPATAANSAPPARPPRYDLGNGGKAHTSMFGVQAEGYKFVYVIDRSGSMGGSGPTALKAAKAELLASLKDLQQTHQFQIVFYNEKPTLFNPTGDPHRTLFASEQNKALAERFIDTITAFDGTRHDEALLLAIRLHPDVIFWLTDADEPKLSAAQLARLERLTAGITIHAIEFGSGPQPEADNFLVQVARQTGGSHRYVDIEKLSVAKENGRD